MYVAFLSGRVRSTGLQQYPGMLCEFDTATFRVPQNGLDMPRQLLQAAIRAGCLSFRTLQRFASKRISMTVAIGPISLLAHAKFAVLADLEKSGLFIVDLTQVSRADMLGRWRKFPAAPPEEPRQRARHLAAVSTQGSFDASSVAWGRVVNPTSSTLTAGAGVFARLVVESYPPDRRCMASPFYFGSVAGYNPDVPRREKCSQTWTNRQ